MSFDIPAPKGWTLVKLSDLGEVNRGRSRHRPRYAEHLYGGQYPFIQTGDVKASGGRITEFTQTYSEAGLAQSRLWPTGTLCITIAANIAETGILSFPACFPDSVIGFIADESKCNVYFVEYMFRLLRARIQAQATGSVQDNINLQTLDRIQFPIPSLEEQNRIVGILNAFDGKLLINTQTNQTLEQMAQALFKSWFVDFDPVIDNALDSGFFDQLAAGDGIPEPLAARVAVRRAVREGMRQALRQAMTEGAPAATGAAAAAGEPTAINASFSASPSLPADIRALFPSSFVEHPELGWIPEGWECVEVKDLCKKVQNGGTPKRNEPTFWEGGDIPWLTSGEVRQGLIVAVDNTITEKGLQSSSAKWLPADVTLIALYGATAGEVAFSSIPLTTNQAVCALIPDLNMRFFNYLAMKNKVAELAGLAVGSAQQNISKGLVESTQVIRPSDSVLEKFDVTLQPIFSYWQANIKQAQSLANLRDTLLPKLLSGELTLAEAGPEAD
ncbi:restriction endonuclease subunit S [Shewanella cyperi]|uniref:Restriction endonuclease subunit S n=1 Tax=Shewanella cyperi TaxID=2814292 RepID=A0A975AJC3_9GAMM|nr:restriction endonuclease subunit S [Shewanella cyperi]QSX28576.1 restriction endonuclease subunit S [Shewanella cyperi]